jgi:hypothetical protein
MLPEFSFPTVTYGIAFLLSVAMDKSLIGGVDPSIQFSIRIAVARIGDAAKVVLHGGPFLGRTP